MLRSPVAARRAETAVDFDAGKSEIPAHIDHAQWQSTSAAHSDRLIAWDGLEHAPNNKRPPMEAPPVMAVTKAKMSRMPREVRRALPMKATLIFSRARCETKYMGTMTRYDGVPPRCGWQLEAASNVRS